MTVNKLNIKKKKNDGFLIGCMCANLLIEA